MVVDHICNPSTQEMETGGSQVQGQRPRTQQDPVVKQRNIRNLGNREHPAALWETLSLIFGTANNNNRESIQLRGCVYAYHSRFPRFKLNPVGIWDIYGLGHSAVTGEGSDRIAWKRPVPKDLALKCTARLFQRVSISYLFEVALKQFGD